MRNKTRLISTRTHIWPIIVASIKEDGYVFHHFLRPDLYKWIARRKVHSRYTCTSDKKFSLKNLKLQKISGMQNIEGYMIVNSKPVAPILKEINSLHKIERICQSRSSITKNYEIQEQVILQKPAGWFQFCW